MNRVKKVIDITIFTQIIETIMFYKKKIVLFKKNANEALSN